MQLGSLRGKVQVDCSTADPPFCYHPDDAAAVLQNDRGVSALGVAIGFNRKAMVELLLNAGADIALRDASDNTVLHYAAGGFLCKTVMPADRCVDARGSLLLLAAAHALNHSSCGE